MTAVPKPQPRVKAPKPLRRKTELKRSSSRPQRSKPLPKPRKPIARSAKPKARRTPKRFAHLRDKSYRSWIATLPCCVRDCPAWLATECAHVKTRGAGGADRENCIPLCTAHHRYQHAMGIQSFQSFYGLDLRALALTYDQRYSELGEAA